MTIGQAIAFVYDPVCLPGRDSDEQSLWAALLLSIMRRSAGGVC